MNLHYTVGLFEEDLGVSLRYYLHLSYTGSDVNDENGEVITPDIVSSQPLTLNNVHPWLAYLRYLSCHFRLFELAVKHCPSLPRVDCRFQDFDTAAYPDEISANINTLFLNLQTYHSLNPFDYLRWEGAEGDLGLLLCNQCSNKHLVLHTIRRCSLTLQKYC